MNISIPLPMCDLKGQYLRIKGQVDAAIADTIDSTRFIRGPVVDAFEAELAGYLGVPHVVGCANGTDALQMALMALDLQPGDEVIVPAFTYVATAEVIGLLRLKPVMVDVDPHSFNLDVAAVEAAITPATKAIVPVHLFGQTADMEAIMQVAKRHGLYVIEDNAQALGARYRMSSGEERMTGTIGHIGCTSFFPAKNLGCYGDGGALFTHDDELAMRLRMIGNHGQSRLYYHDMLGTNSRLDALQAAVLRVKLPHLDDYGAARAQAAQWYNELFAGSADIICPVTMPYTTHVFHQYTLQIRGHHREGLRSALEGAGIPSMIYYPVPLYRQQAFAPFCSADMSLPVTEQLCQSVVSLPMHTELDRPTVEYIASQVLAYFSNLKSP